jgi:hypothetical protein
MNLFTKQPGDQLDYDLDFTDWLPSGDVITGVVAASSVPAELVILSASVAGTIVKIWSAGGVIGQTYIVSTTVSTQQGRIKLLDFKIRVRGA